MNTATKMLRNKKTGEVLPYNPDVARSDTVEVFTPVPEGFKADGKPTRRRRSTAKTGTAPKRQLKKNAPDADAKAKEKRPAPEKADAENVDADEPLLDDLDEQFLAELNTDEDA